MQLETQGVKTQISGAVGQTSKFRAEMDATGFDIFSNGLYSRKIEAVIRELSCNAYDSHIAAGKRHEPFQVQLPTQFDPIFSIKDTGTGLRFTKGGCEECKGTGNLDGKTCEDCDGTGDYDGVMRLVCTYFASNKRKSNEFVGALGLGSKSPFAYLNRMKATGVKEAGGFDIANTYSEKTYFYTAAIGETGFPAATLISIADAPGSPNGVEVKFPVATNDIWEFENTAKYVYEFFNPHPVFTGDKSVSITVPTYSIRTDLWGMRSTAATTQTSGLRAISGVVPYSINNIDQSRLTDAQKKLISMPIDLFFNIGDLSIAASRETLQLDPKTVTNILARLDLVQDKLMEEIKAKVDACPSAWEARLKIHELMLQPGMGAIVNDAYNKGMLDGKYKGFRLSGGAKVEVNELDYNNITAIEFRHSDRARGKAKKDNLFETADNNRRAAALRDVASGVAKKSDYTIKFEVNENTVFIIDDLRRGSADKYVSHMLQNDVVRMAKYRKAIVLKRQNKAIALDRAATEAVALIEKVGNPPAIKASDLKLEYDPAFKAQKAAQLVKRERMSVRVLSRYVQYTRRSSGSGWKKQWNKGDDNPLLTDFSATKYYIEVGTAGEGLAATGSFYHGSTFVEFVNKVREADLFPEIQSHTPIFGIRKGSKLLSDTNFVELTTFVKNRVVEELTPAKQMAMSLTVNPFHSVWKVILDYVVEHPMVLSHDSPVRKFALALNDAERIDRTGFVALTNLAPYFGLVIDNTADYNKAWTKVENIYPMLKFCSRRYHYNCTIDEKTAVTSYIRSVDAENKRQAAAPSMTISNVVAIDEREVVNA